jgi:hypothetical protein
MPTQPVQLAVSVNDAPGCDATRELDGNGDSSGSSQPPGHTHDSIQSRSDLITRRGRPLRLISGRPEGYQIRPGPRSSCH